MRSILKSKSGTLLLEVLIVTFLFGVLGTGLIGSVVTSLRASKQGTEYVVASGYIKEGIEAVRSIRDQDWSEIINGTHGLSTGSGYYAFSGTSETIDSIYTRTITVEDVTRLGSLIGDIFALGVFDANTKKITVNVTWETLSGKIQNIDDVFYVTNWDNLSWIQTLTANFTSGVENSTTITTSDNGEVQLRAHDRDWDNTYVQHSIDLPGSGNWETSYLDDINDILYLLANNTAGDDFVAYDTSDVSGNTPTFIAGYDIQNANDFVVSDGYAYIATNDSSAEVSIINLSTMALVSTIDLPGVTNTNTVAIFSDILVIGRDSSLNDELVMYDITIPSSPNFLLSTNVSASFNDMVASATHIFATSDNNTQEVFSFLILDGSQVGTLDMDGTDNAGELYLVDDNLFVARDDGTSYDFALVDISDPTAMSVTNSLELGASIFGIDIDTNQEYAFLATNNGSEEIMVINLSSFSKEIVMNITGTDIAESVAVYGGSVFVGSASNSNDLMIVRVQSGGWTTPTLIASVDKSGAHNANEIYVSGNYAYLVTQNNASLNELWIYDVTIPSSPTYLGSFDVGSDVNDIVVSGSIAYLATANNSRELDVVDVSNPTSPARIGSLSLNGTQDATTVAISGNYAYIGRIQGTKEEFAIIDISTPASPVKIGELQFSDDVNDLTVSGNYVYGATSDNSKELVVFDVATPATPSEAANYNLSTNTNANTVALSGSVLTIGRANSASSGELAVLDITTPISPSLFGEGEVGGTVSGVYMDNSNYVYMASGKANNEFQRWDISTPSSPIEDVVFDLNANANGVYFNGTNAFLATDNDTMELQIIGEGSPPSQYSREGTMTSQAFESGAVGTMWSIISWSETGTGDVFFRIRTANSEANLATAKWVGSDGTSNTTYSTSNFPISVDPGASGTQWIQWKAYLIGSGLSTPVLEDVTLQYTQ
jgi:hypothetical protein